ncbi:ferric iron uptake transcriptional regulator [Gammaproteobacteria bacterium]|nr:ferric iron uptake transcriptional regulator [Gammaproteobacteria bacterium]
MSEDKNLRKAGLKVTLPRVRILEIFEQSSERHLSAEDIYNKIREAGDEVGLATVYRVLTQFESAGILMKQNFEDNYSVYELVSDDHHDHMVCLDSGAVIEFKNDLIEEEQEKIAKEHGYKIVDHKLVLYVTPLDGKK